MIFYFFNFFDVLNIATIYSIINILYILIIFNILRNFLKKSKLETSKKNHVRNKNLNIIDILKKSKNFIAANIFFIFYAPIDILLLKYFVGTYELGIFSAANIIIIGTYLFTEAYMKIYSFRYYYYSKFNFSKFRKLYKNGNFVLLFFSIFLVTILVSISQFIINFFYGIEYRESIKILIILSLSIPFRFIWSNYLMVIRTYNYATYESEIFKNLTYKNTYKYLFNFKL